MQGLIFVEKFAFVDGTNARVLVINACYGFRSARVSRRSRRGGNSRSTSLPLVSEVGL